MKLFNILFPALAILVLSTFPIDIISQNIKVNYLDKIQCESDKCNLNIGFINYGSPEILTIDVSIPDKAGTSVLKDTFIIERGIQQYKKQILIKDIQWPTAMGSNGFLFVEIKKKNNQTIFKSEEKILIREKKTSLQILNNGLKIKLSKNEEHFLRIMEINPAQSGSDTLFISFDKDTVLKSKEVITKSILSDKQLEITLRKGSKVLLKDTAYYHLGKLHNHPKALIKTEAIQTLNIDSTALKKFPIQQRNGEFSISHYSYSTTPHFDDGSQFPNTILRLYNSLDVFSIPIRIEGYYSSSDRVHSAFKDYFNVSLDGTTLRNRKASELLNAEKEKITAINTQIDAHEKLKSKLKSMKQVLNEYPDYSLNVDSLVQSESAKINKTGLKDSLQFHQPNIDDSLYLPDQAIPQFDSLNNYQDSSAIRKLELYIERLDKIIEKKENLKNKMLSNPELVDPNRLDRKSLYQLGNNRFEKILLRFNNLEIGNFYEYAGEYSIRDIEIKGVNTSLQLSPTLGLNFLTGKVNDVMFGSDVYTTSQKDVTSIALDHSTKSFTSGIRFTNFSDKDKETAKANNVIYSGFLKGDLLSFMQYEAELNYNPEEAKSKLNETNSIKSNSANSFKLSANPFKSINVFAKYDYIGESYHSDGVYFMQNNMEIYDIGTDIGFFKNKIKTKVAYRYQRRNISDKSVKNDNKKWLFELRSNWNRFPNIHIIHSPASMELASQLDTSLIKLDVNSFVTIYRLFYQKKIKKTQITSMVMYNNISNSYNDEYNYSQSSVLSSFYIINESRGFSFNLSHIGFYDKIRYVSVSGQEPLLGKHLIKLQVLRYFNNIEEWSTNMPEYLIRGLLEFTIKKNYTLGIGSVATTYKNHEPEFGLTLEGRVRW